jgi:hypothetical protein
VIDAGAGTDTLNLNMAGTAMAMSAANVPTFSGIEIINLSSLTGTTTLVSSLAPSLTTLNLASYSAASAVSVSVASAAMTTFSISNSTIAASDLTVVYATGATAGAETVTLNLNAANAAGSTTTDDPALIFEGSAAGSTNGIETFVINATGSNALEVLTSLEANAQPSALKAVTINGTGSLSIAGALVFDSALVGTINASANSGGVTVTTGNTDDAIIFTGGSGNDRINFSAGKFTNADVVTFGGGTDILGLGDTTFSDAFYALVNATGAEKLGLIVGTGQVVDMSKVTASTILVANNATGNTISSLASTDTVEISTAATGTTSIDATASLGFNTLNVVFAGSATAAANIATLTATGQATINIVSNGTSATTNQVDTAITNSVNAVINITGSQAIKIDDLAAAAYVNAADLTGKLVIVGDNAATTIIGGTKDDSITLSTVAGGDTGVGNAGNDTFTIIGRTGTTVDKFTGGLGADTYAFGKTDVAAAGSSLATINATAAESYATGSQFDTITTTEGADVDGGQVLTITTGVLAATVTAFTTATFVVGTTAVIAGSFAWVNATGLATALAEDSILYQDSNNNGIIDATDFQITVDVAGTTDTLAVAIVGNKAVVTVDYVG